MRAFFGEEEDGEEAEVQEEIAKYRPGADKSVLRKLLSPALTQAFFMTLVGEWGDRSQLATLGLAAAQGPLGVMAGGVLGQGIAMGVAALFGRGLSQRVSERQMGLLGGALLLFFGAQAGREAYALLPGPGRGR